MGDEDWTDRGLRSLFSRPGVEPRTFPLPRVFIVSDVRLCREGLALSLASRQSVGVMGSASATEALQRVAMLRPDVVVLGAEVDPALDLPRRLRERAPGVKTIAIAASDSEQDLLAWAEAGASAYAGPDFSADDLVDVIYQVMRGELVCPPRLTALLFGRIASLSAGHVRESAGPALTQREREIVPLLEDGLSNKEIARRLRIGSATVKNHVHNILEKLQVRRRGEISARIRRPHDSGPAVVPATPAVERWPV